jgi:hypothetical protein
MYPVDLQSAIFWRGTYSGTSAISLHYAACEGPHSRSLNSPEFSETCAARLTPPCDLRQYRRAGGVIEDAVFCFIKRWPGESGQWVKWIFCLRAAQIAADQERA